MIMTTCVRRLTFRFTITVAGLAAMIALALLYYFEPLAYYRVFKFIGMAPLRYPFLDLEFILASVDCWQQGIDVYVNDPCDVLGRPFDYSPVWLRFTFLPGKDWTNQLGLFLSVSFFLALAILPSPRSARELLLRLAATLSPITTFAVERGNIDLLIFVIATAAGALLLKPLHGRIAAYAMIVMAGLLKIYPFVLIVLTLHERPRVFLWINGAAAAVMVGTGVYFHEELMKMALNTMYEGRIGAYYLPDAIADMIGTALNPGFPPRLVRLVISAALFFVMAGWFFYLVRWHDFRSALAHLPEPEKMFLLIGAALIGGCFFAGSMYGFRGIHLLFTLPGLLAMAHMGNHMGVRKAAVQAYVLVVVLMWAPFFISVLRHILPVWVVWLLIQIAWWQVATLFIAILVGCCSNWLEAVPERRGARLPRKSTPAERQEKKA
jgi:hypothetical protein